MLITRLEHCGLLIDSAGTRLGIDLGDFTAPEAVADLGLSALVITHQHPDHYFEPNVRAAAAPVAAPRDVIELLPVGLTVHALHPREPFELAGFRIIAVPADHGPRLSRPIENYGLIIEHAGRRIYVIGDMAVATETPPHGPFDHVFISIDDSGFVFTARQAADFLTAIGHRGRVTPIHDGGEDGSCADEFARLAAGRSEVLRIAPGDSIEVASC